MAKEICISTTPHETRLAILEDDQLAEIYYERENEYTLAGSIYKGRVTRVLPGMQSAFVDVGLERDAFLYVTDFLEEQDDSEEYERSSDAGRPREPRVRSADEPGTEAAAEPREEARGRGERGDRGGRSRRDQAPRAPQQTERQPRASVEVQAMPAPAELTAGVAEKGDDEEAVEGTRRWRGRRGRRRGVRGSQPAREPQADLSPDAAAEEFESGDLLDTPERGAPGGIASLHGVAHFAEEHAPAGEARTETRAQSQSPRVPRGFGGPSRIAAFPDAHAVLPGEAAPAAGAPVDAIVLPGESISKYGGATSASAATTPETAAPAARASNFVPFKPATLVELSSGWDGGAVLPGESLSRYRGAGGPATAATEAADPAQESVHLSASAEETPGEEALHHEGPAAEFAQEVLSTDILLAPETVAEALAPVEHEHSPEVTEAPTEVEPVQAEPAEVEPGHAAPESLTETEEQPSGAHSEEAAAAAEPAQHEEAHTAEPADYEPENASASYRVDPGGASELRIPGLASLTAALGFGSRETASPEPSSEGHHETDHNDQHEAAAANGHVAGDSHEVGSAHAHEQEQQHEHATVAFEHEDHEDEGDHNIRLSPAAEAQQRDAEGSFEHQADHAQGFSPGSGLLEEEVIDEDEYEYSPIELHRDDDFEELEEETLDHRHEMQVEPSVLGDAVRDSHLNLRLGHGAQANEPEGDEAEERFGPGAIQEYDEDEEEDGEEGALAPPPSAPATLSAPTRYEGERGRSSGRGRRGGPGAHGNGRGRRAESQLSNVPVISELLKQGQEILVQIAKEPIAKKGARITSHIALPGRFLVFMPTVNHVGVSRKISSDEERQRLKHILISEKGDFSGGFIVRTAADGASEEDLRADLRFLINLWSEIKQRSDSGKAPALIYHDLNLIERILRDQVSSNFSTIWVDSEAEYERILRFLNRFQPQLVRRVKLYTKETPLFEQFGIQEEITKALKSKVWLKSGGSIVINQTEALVAIDINTGKYVGKTARLEDTIVKTNLDAIPEIVRQIRLRDLGGIIVIDFIDMDDRRNRNKVLAALEEALKADRAPSKVLQFNDFGLVAITRKRVKQSLERTLSVQCETCTGTGMVKSPTTVCNEIYIEMRKMQKHFDRGDVMLRVNPEVVKALKQNNGKWIMELEEMISKTIIIKSDPALHPEQFDIH